MSPITWINTDRKEWLVDFSSASSDVNSIKSSLGFLERYQ